MNIVKFKDNIIPQDLIFNKFFKSRYAYAINWKYVVPFDVITNKEFITHSMLDSVIIDNDEYDSYDDDCEGVVDDSSYIDVDVRENVCPMCNQLIDNDTDASDKTRVRVTFTPFMNARVSIIDDESFIDGAFTFRVTCVPNHHVYKIFVNDVELNNDGSDVYTTEIKTDTTIDVCVIRNNSLNAPVLLLSDYMSYVDNEKTSEINDVESYRYMNNFVSDDDITEQELRRFRTYVAESFLALTHDLNEYDEKMLKYYANEMNDESLRMLMKMTTMIPMNNIVTDTAQCGCSASQSQLYLTSAANAFAGTCDFIAMYRAGMHRIMVNFMTNIDTWMPHDLFINDVKRYLENIMKMNFSLYKINTTSFNTDCSLLNEKNASQMSAHTVLNNMIIALTHIQNKTHASHMNFIKSTFNTFFESYYEIMRW